MFDEFSMGDPSVESEIMKIIVEVCILVGAALAAVRPKWLLYFLIFSLIESSRRFSLVDYTILDTVNIKYCELAMLLLYAGAVFNRVRPLWSSVKISMVLFFVFALLSLINGAMFYSYGDAAFNQFRPFFGMGMFIAVPLLFKTPDEARPVLRFFLIITCVMGAIELAEVLKINPLSTWVRSDRRLVTVSFLGGSTGAILAMPFLYLMSAWRTTRARTLFVIAAMVWCFVLSVLSASRGVWLGLIAGICGVIWLMPLRRKISLLWTAALLVLLLTIGLKSFYIERYDMAIGDRLRSIVDPQEGTARWRLDAWYAMIENIRARPLLGWPFGTELPFFVYSAGYYEYQAPHNDYLKIGCYTGLLGLGSFLWFLASILVPAFRLLYHLPYSSTYYELVGLVMCFLFHVIVSFVTQDFTTMELSPIIWGLAGLIHLYTLTNSSQPAAPSAASS